uniref:Uncharacterized protein n=1 Tax=Parascaris equorum TaxID=6256 RepID=A0A914RAH4_PAREQ
MMNLSFVNFELIDKFSNSEHNIVKFIEYKMPKKHTTSNKTRKRKGKDMDQIVEDLKPAKVAKLSKQEVMDSSIALNAIGHRQRVKSLREVPYSHAEAEAAGGLGIYNPFASK